MTRIMYFLVTIVISGVLGYPSVPSTQGFSTADRLAEDSGVWQRLDGPFLRQTASAPVPGVRRSDVQLSHPDITQVITTRPGYSAEYNVRQDPPLSEDELQSSEGHRRKRDAEQVEGSEDDEEDNSDMYMEPQEAPSEQETVEEQPSEVATESEDNHGMGQHFFPSFAPVFSLGHSRPPQLFHQENFYNKPRSPPPTLRPEYNPFRAYRDSSYKVPVTVEDDATSNNILGSGNFGVIRGGTYYNDEDRDDAGSLFNPYYSNNGHGRPYSANPRPQKYTNGDFFANFRDFADINTPTKASFSEYVIVYVNKNATKADSDEASRLGAAPRPKNIIEQLSLLDKEEPAESTPNHVEEAKPPKKVSLHKRKLALLHEEKTNKQKKSYFKKKESPKELEPLLALS